MFGYAIFRTPESQRMHPEILEDRVIYDGRGHAPEDFGFESVQALAEHFEKLERRIDEQAREPLSTATTWLLGVGVLVAMLIVLAPQAPHPNGVEHAFNVFVGSGFGEKAVRLGSTFILVLLALHSLSMHYAQKVVGLKSIFMPGLDLTPNLPVWESEESYEERRRREQDENIQEMLEKSDRDWWEDKLIKDMDRHDWSPSDISIDITDRTS